MRNYLTNAPQLNAKIDGYYFRSALRFVLLDYGEYECVAALYNGRIVDYPAATKPKDDRFFSHASEYSGVSSIEDAMIKAGIMSVVGRVTGEPDRYGQYKDEAVLTFDDEWYDSLPALRMYYKHSENAVADNTIDVKYEVKYDHIEPVARVKRGDFTWEIEAFRDGDYRIHGSHDKDNDKGFFAGHDLPLVETWLKAMHLERAMDEFVDAGKRIAEKYGVSFVNNLIEHVAAGYWYLEG